MHHPSPTAARRAGVALRQVTERSAHAAWSAPAHRRDPVQVLIDQGADRIAELLPIRYARMQADPFAFFRGGAAIMAGDLAHTPTSGLRLQLCGDCHLGNFGVYASPEGTPVFDINDFDETLPAPFEWDMKRLAASLVVAGQVASLGDRECRKLARIAARSYREHIAALAKLPPIDAWSRPVDLAGAIAAIDVPRLQARLHKRLAAVLASGQAHFNLLSKDGRRIRDQPPLVSHFSQHELNARKAFASYAGTLQEDRRVLLSRYVLQDVAMKVVGVGSVGTFCVIGLFVSADGAPLLLQVKQAEDSVLAPFAEPSAYGNGGERVVTGQRMMQATSDVFLGWTERAVSRRSFYVRRLKDGRLADLGAMLEGALPFYAGLCGRTLARAHARAGDAAAVAGYLGHGAAFDAAIAEFAVAYAAQNGRDFEAFRHAIKAGRVKVA